MRQRINFLIILISLVLLIPGLIFADRGMIVWPPGVNLDQSAQNAIVAWNGEEEIIILSTDIKSNATATALEVLPLPSNPSEITEGSFESFGKIVEIMNEKIEAKREQFLRFGKGLAPPDAGIEITFQKKIGAHDITVIKVNDLDYFLDWIKDFSEEKGLGIKQISLGFKQGVNNYLKRDIKYFVFDVIETEGEEESINPLIYRFSSDFLYYPLLISGISEIGESRGKIDVFVITENEIPQYPFSQSNIDRWWDFGFEVEFTQEELKEVTEEIANLFNSSTKVRKVSYYGYLNTIEKDLMMYPFMVWEKYLSMGSYGDEIKALQKILINEGVWESEVGATGFFGPITKNTLAKFQEKYNQEILQPLGLEVGTGYFGAKTRNYLKRLSIEVEEIKKEIKWDRNLAIGMRGEDVKALQEILIKEGVWSRPDIGASGYFGSITKDALIKFQEKYKEEILEPLGLEKGTGFFGPSTRSFLKNETEAKTNENEKYYGSSTNSYCKTSGCCGRIYCTISGCNREICQSGKEGEIVSICIVPQKPTPEKLGYQCECLKNKCQWIK